MTGFQICLASWHCLPKEYSMADWKTTSGFSVNTRIFTLGRSIYLIGIFSFLAEYLCFVFALWHLPFFTDMTWFSFSNRSRRFPKKASCPLSQKVLTFCPLVHLLLSDCRAFKPSRFAHITFIWMSCLDLPHFFCCFSMYENRKMMDVTHINHLFLPIWAASQHKCTDLTRTRDFREAFCAQTLDINEKLGNQFSNPMLRP